MPIGTIEVGPYLEESKVINYAGERHRADSNLLVVEGCFDQDAHPKRRDCARRYYVWTDERRFVLLLREATRVPKLVR